MRVTEKIGNIMTDFTQIDRQLIAVSRTDCVFIQKCLKFLHNLIIHDGRIVAFGNVGAGQVGLQIAVKKTGFIESNAAVFLDICE